MPDLKERKINRHISFTENIWNKIKELSEETGNSPSALIRKFVFDGLKKGGK